MNKLRKTLLIFITCLSSTAIAQKASGIAGIVMDSLPNKPVEFAIEAILHPTTNKPINGTVCDENGKFAILKTAKGNYILILSFVGYTSKKITTHVSEKGSETNL